MHKLTVMNELCTLRYAQAPWCARVCCCSTGTVATRIPVQLLHP